MHANGNRFIIDIPFYRVVFPISLWAVRIIWNIFQAANSLRKKSDTYFPKSLSIFRGLWTVQNITFHQVKFPTEVCTRTIKKPFYTGNWSALRTKPFPFIIYLQSYLYIFYFYLYLTGNVTIFIPSDWENSTSSRPIPPLMRPSVCPSNEYC